MIPPLPRALKHPQSEVEVLVQIDKHKISERKL